MSDKQLRMRIPMNTMASVSGTNRGNQTIIRNSVHMRAWRTPMYSMMSMGGLVSKQAP